MVDSNFSLHLDQVDENCFVGAPMLDDVPLGREQAAQGDEVQELNWHLVFLGVVLKELNDLQVIRQLVSRQVVYHVDHFA